MAFEQNATLQRLLGPSYTQPMMQQQSPTMGFSPLNNQNSWGDFFKNLISGTPERQLYSTPFSPTQGQGLEQLLAMGLQNQQNPYQDFDLLKKEIEDYYYQNILPQTAERFASRGSNALSSPNYARDIGNASKGLASMLLQHKLNFGQQNRQFGLQQAQAGLRPQFESAYSPRQPGALEDIWNTGKNITQQAIPFALRALAGGF